MMSFSNKENLFNKLIEANLVAIVVTNSQGQIIFANERAGIILNLPVDEITTRLYNDSHWKITDRLGNPLPEEELPFRQIMTTQQPLFDFEHIIEWPTGERRLISVSGMPVEDEAGEISSVVFLIDDITNRKETEARLRSSEERFRQVVSSISDHIYVTEVTPDMRYNNRYLSPHVATLTGYPYESFINDWSFWPTQVIHPTDQSVAATQARRLAAGQDSEVEYRLIRADGEIVWVRDSARVVQQSQNTTIYGVVSDITERKKAEAEIHQRNRELALLNAVGSALNQSSDLEKALTAALEQIVTLLRISGAECHLANESGVLEPVAHYGLSAEYIVASQRHRFPAWGGVPGHVFATGQPLYVPDLAVETRCLRRDMAWSKGYWSLLSVPIDNQDSILGAFTLYTDTFHQFSEESIVALKTVGRQLAVAIERLRLFEQTQAALTQADALYRISRSLIGFLPLPELLQRVVEGVAGLLSANQVTLVTFDLEAKEITNFVTSGPGQEEIEPLPFDELWQGLSGWVLRERQPALSLKDYPDPRESPAVRQRRRQIGAGSIIVVPLQYHDKLFGTITAINHRNEPNFNHQDVDLMLTITNLAAIALENAHLYEQAQQEITERIRVAKELRQSETRLRSVLNNVVDGIITIDPQGTIESFNTAAEKIFQYSAEEMIDHKITRLIPDSNLEPDQLHYVEQRQEMRGRRKDGSIFPLDLALSEFRLEQQDMFIAVIRDLTEQQRLKEQFHQAQKMEAVGRLTGGVAHDFNNILTVINGHCDLLLQAAAGQMSEAQQDEIEQIKQATERAAILARQLLTFSRRHPLKLQPVDLNRVIHNLEKMLRQLIGEEVRLQTDLATDLGQIEADPALLEQLLMNLTVNALDAMPDGGRLTITTANTTITDSDQMKAGSYVSLFVTDTGIGIDPDIQSYIFEPFFTTKEVGKGTGLGLATVLDIVQQNKGYIQVESQPGQGTTFAIYLPHLEETVDLSLPAKPKTTETFNGTETILLVEDEDSVRLITRRFLQKQGYTVLEASNAHEAEQICNQYDGRIDLLITDVIMPGASGRNLTDRLSQLRPDLKTLYISGYADDILDQHGVLKSEVLFLQKPFSADSLGQKVREALEQE